MILQLRNDLATVWPQDKAFEQARTQSGDIYRDKEGRRTLRFEANDKSYFLKYHAGIGWKEIGKNLSQAKLPVISAMNEVRAIKAVAKAGIDTMTIAGFGERTLNPAKRESFIVTEDLSDTLSLEDAAKYWAGKLHFHSKRRLIKRLADISYRLHQAGINHRDYYLCHFLIKRTDFEQQNWNATIYLIDLHRSQVRRHVPKRWQIKDLSGLYFSAAPLGLSRTDLLRFIRTYSGQSAASAIKQQPALWKMVKKDAERLYRRFYNEPTHSPLQLPACYKEAHHAP